MNKEHPLAQPPASAGADAPSDLELMMFFDGELEEPRRSMIAAYLGRDLKAQNKLAGMRITSAVVQYQANQPSAADAIADRVMAQIERERAQVVPQPQAPIMLDPRASVVAKPAANDNSRRIFVGLVALVAAAAAAFAVWTKQPASTHSTENPVAVHTTQPPAPSQVGTQADTNSPEIDAAVVNPEPESEHGVEVAAVNFGAHMGSIFYVPSGSVDAQRTTTVVWLADDAGE